MAKTERQKAIASADKKWADRVKDRARYQCEYCKKSHEYTTLHAHHIFSRKHLGTRWLTDNGICLCAHCHLYLAHRDTATFMLWVQRKLGKGKIEILEIKAHAITKLSTAEIKLLARHFGEVK